MKDSMKYRLNKFFDIMATNFRGFRMYCMCLNVNWLNRVTAWHLRSNKIRIETKIQRLLLVFATYPWHLRSNKIRIETLVSSERRPGVCPWHLRSNKIRIETQTSPRGILEISSLAFKIQ